MAYNLRTGLIGSGDIDVNVNLTGLGSGSVMGSGSSSIVGSGSVVGSGSRAPGWSDVGAAVALAVAAAEPTDRALKIDQIHRSIWRIIRIFRSLDGRD